MTGVGATVWFTGLPSAGKSTVAGAVAAALAELGVPTETLDGDELRANLCADLGFTAEDRRTNVRRIGFVAELLARHGVVALVPVIAPYADSRAAARAHHERRGTVFVEVYVDTTLAVCAERDVKGLYRRQRAGELSGLTGVDDPYEKPTQPDVVATTDGCSPSESAAPVLAALAAAGVVTAGPVGVDR